MGVDWFTPQATHRPIHMLYFHVSPSLASKDKCNYLLYMVKRSPVACVSNRKHDTTNTKENFNDHLPSVIALVIPAKPLNKSWCLRNHQFYNKFNRPSTTARNLLLDKSIRNPVEILLLISRRSRRSYCLELLSLIKVGQLVDLVWPAAQVCILSFSDSNHNPILRVP